MKEELVEVLGTVLVAMILAGPLVGLLELVFDGPDHLRTGFVWAAVSAWVRGRLFHGAA